MLPVLCDFARLMLQLYRAYTVDDFCHYILPVLIENLAKDHVAEVRLAAVEVVSRTAILGQCVLIYMSAVLFVP